MKSCRRRGADVCPLLMLTRPPPIALRLLEGSTLHFSDNKITDARKEVAASRAADSISVEYDTLLMCQASELFTPATACRSRLIHECLGAVHNSCGDDSQSHELRRRGDASSSRLAHGGDGPLYPRRLPSHFYHLSHSSRSSRIQSYARGISSCRKIVSGFRK